MKAFFQQNQCRFRGLGKSGALVAMLQSPMMLSLQLSICTILEKIEPKVLRVVPIDILGGL